MIQRSLSLLLTALVLLTAGVRAQEVPAADESSDRLVVAVREVPPFAMRDNAGNWRGLSVDLWARVAETLSIEFDWRELPLDETIEALRSDEIDVAVAAISVTSAREEFVDFSHPYYVTGLAPAFASGGASPWLATTQRFFSLEFLSAVGSLAIVLLVAGFCLWLFERNANAEQFGGGNLKRGLGESFWWSAVTMTTVGYGDRVPKTFGGRAVAVVWMFVSLVIIASFTASIAASLTANELSAGALRDRSISEMSVGVLAGSAAQEYAGNQGALVSQFDSVSAAIAALGNGQIDMVLHDAPILRYEIRNARAEVEVAERVLVREDYAFALPQQSPIRDEINVALLAILTQPVWQSIKAQHIGAGDNVLD